MWDRVPGAGDGGAGHPLPGVSRWLEARERWVVAAIGLLALAVRLIHLWQIGEHDPFFDNPSVDPEVYHRWATRLAGGDWIGEEVFFLSPLYPYFLGALYWLVGPSLFAAKLVQMLLGALDCVLVYLIARRVFGAAAGALAGLMLALYAPSIFYDGVLLVTALQTPLNLLLVWLLLRAERAPSLLVWALAGICLGLSVVARPNVLLLAFLVPPWIVFALRDRLRVKRAVLAAAVFLVAAAAMVLPVTARNHAVGDDAVLVSSQGGVNFYIGNGPDAIGSFRVPRLFPKTRADDPGQQQEAYRAYAEHRSGRKLTPSEVSDFWYDETWDHIGENPGGWASLLVEKLGLFVNHYEIGNSRDFYSSRQFSAVLELPLLTFGAICPLALLGLVVAARRVRRAYPLYAMVATYAVSLVIFFVLAHYRMPVVPFFAIFAALGLVWLLERIARFRPAPVLAAIVGLTAAVAVTQLDLTDESQARFMIHYNLGNKYRLIGRRDLALAEYERSIELDPTYISAHHNLALLSEEQPMDVERAIEAWKQVLELGIRRGDRDYVERARKHLLVLERMNR
jgi:4-amino-4-deoxy-L-arabinose transferase-like glycosyltransferase